MNRHDIIKEIARHLTTEKDAKMAVHRIFEMMAAALRSNEKVVISNFGTFRVKERQPRQMRNPKTNQKVMVGPRKSIRFKPSKKVLMGI
ncbi:MAG TPA: HU family DNA-binding protein [Elusimicrobiales bacterium]|nr:HU family DNA-binding protein [Elusimicrobiales bacterium]